MIKLKGKKVSESLICLCPFHEEKTPSFVVDLVTKGYHCYGCKKRGSLEDLAEEGYSIEYET